LDSPLDESCHPCWQSDNYAGIRKIAIAETKRFAEELDKWLCRKPWWNSGAQYMSFAFPKKYFDSLGLVSR